MEAEAPYEIEQRSAEWFEARLGKATASRFKDILTVTKNGAESSARKNYRAQVIVERITGQQAIRFSSAAMEWGTETEDLAKLAYTMRTGNSVEDVGFIQHPTLMAGASPDGLVGDDGCIEIKCKLTANHIEVLKAGTVPSEHIAQIQGQLWIAERQWCDFISFEPTLPENAQLFIQRVNRDEAYISRLRGEVAIFLDEVDADLEFVRNYKQEPTA